MQHMLQALLAAIVVCISAASEAQPFPSRSVTLTVGFAPGGGTDTAARVIAQKLSENIHQPVVVDNKAGAGGNIAAQHIATAPPDGYTIHLTSVGPMAVAPHMVKNLPYDPMRDAPPVAMIGPSAPNGPPVPIDIAAESGFRKVIFTGILLSPVIIFSIASGMP